MSDGIMLGMVPGKSACVKAAREPSKTATAQTRRNGSEEQAGPARSHCKLALQYFCYRNEMRHAFLNAGQGLSGYRR